MYALSSPASKWAEALWRMVVKIKQFLTYHAILLILLWLLYWFSIVHNSLKSVHPVGSFSFKSNILLLLITLQLISDQVLRANILSYPRTSNEWCCPQTTHCNIDIVDSLWRGIFLKTWRSGHRGDESRTRHCSGKVNPFFYL